ncbi:glycosyltransferase family 1 protein [Bacillus massiliigorillae]|uniref:glycosyltransferase family 1 protein n=1 Tax=Bacillus massiliigorillae TaxID=1243664 RepID=UPI0003A82B4F|nr:glycosyltransferase family 1 protein [Bacillus massiliigorillae]
MIRVLHKVHSLEAGGIQSFIMNVYRNIDRSKIQFDFLVSEINVPGGYDDEILYLGGRIYEIPNRRQGVLNTYRKLNAFFKEHPNYKIIHAHLSSLTDVSSLRVAKRHRVPVRIVHSHNIMEGGSKLHKYLHQLNQYSIQSYATDYFSCSDLAGKWMYPNNIYHNHKFHVVNNGIDTEKFIFNESVRKSVREELNILDKYVVGHIGRFHPQKNHDFLIDIFKELHDQQEDAVLLLVGDGDLRPKIQEKVSDLGLNENVIFTGVRCDIPQLLQAMDVFVFPSVYEGLGIALIEAQASGLNCFTSNKVVPADVNITNLVKFMDLSKSAKQWAKEILLTKNDKRKMTKEDIEKAGYDIHQVTKNLQKWYELKALIAPNRERNEDIVKDDFS